MDSPYLCPDYLGGVENSGPIGLDRRRARGHDDGGVESDVVARCPGNHASANQTLVDGEAQHSAAIIDVVQVTGYRLLCWEKEKKGWSNHIYI